MTNRGFTITSLSVGVGIGMLSLSLLGLGIKMSNESMERIRIHSTLTDVSQDIRDYIVDDVSWDNTVKDIENVSMECLRTGVDCSGQTVPSMLKLITTNNLLYYNAIPVTSGFTVDGILCNSYSSAGNNDCPIRVELMWNAVCSALKCVNPDIFISVNFIYNPDPNSKRANLVNTSVYNFTFLRRDNSIHDDLLVIYLHPVVDPATPGPKPGEGNCSPGDWTARRLNRVVYDKGSNVSLVSALVTNTRFQLKGGIYRCSLRAQAYDTGESRLRLYNVTAATLQAESPSYYTGEERSVELEIETNLVLNQDTIFELQQYCERTGGQPHQFDFGVPITTPGGFYTQSEAQIFTVVDCTRIK